MFDYKTDRLNYGELLVPPAGYVLSKAVATTYSMEMEILTAASIALGLNEATDSQLLCSKVGVFDAIENVSQKLVVFCEAGQISMPSRPSPLHVLFEKSIVPVALPGKPKSNIYPSFHPKSWLLEYEKTEKGKRVTFYRFIVMSRNLTSDRSWDVSVALDGVETKSKNEKSRPIKSFLDFLGQQIKKTDPDYRQKNRIINDLSSKIEYVDFGVSADSRQFSDYEILPLGIGGNNSAIWSHEELFNDKPCHDIAVMTPFLTHDIIETLNNKLCRLKENNRGILITRRSELSLIKDVVSNFDVYVMKDAIIDGENNLPESYDGEKFQRQDIHAKMFLYRKYSDTQLYLGSMNASERGTGVFRNDNPEEKAINVELMVKLKTNNYYLNSEKFRHDVIGDDEAKSPFQKVSFETVDAAGKTTDPVNILLQNLKRVCRFNLDANVIDMGSSFAIRIKCRGKDFPEGISIHPLYAPGLECPLGQEMSFEGLNVNQVSELYCIKSTDGTNKTEKVILIPTKGIPEERDKSIIRYAISNRKEFSDWVAFALGDDNLQTMIDLMGEAEKQGEGRKNRPAVMTSLYERMIKVVCREPERLKEIKKIVDIIDDETIVPEEFKKMYQIFLETLKLCPRRPKKD